MEYTGPEQQGIVERATLSEHPREFAARMGWTTFGASLGACLGVVMSKQSGWALVLAVVLVPLVSVIVVMLVWLTIRYLGMWIVNMAWRDWFSDPCGHAPACPECEEVWSMDTRCCGACTLNYPPRNRDRVPYCPECKSLNPVHACCGKPWTRRSGTYVDGHGVMTDRDWRQRPAMWPDWRPSIRDVLWSLVPKRFLPDPGFGLADYFHSWLSRVMPRRRTERSEL